VAARLVARSGSRTTVPASPCSRRSASAPCRTDGRYFLL